MGSEAAGQLERLLGVMATLRGPNGCPWDKEQDLASLRPFLVEETFEVLDEMDRVVQGAPWKAFCEELGDLLFQIVFHAQLASEQKQFAFADVCRAIADKLESRHPHVFGDAKVTTSAEVLGNWEKLKAAEKKKKQGRDVSVLDGVPSAAPSLLRAERLTEKASRIGFDWPDLASVRAQLAAELAELDEALDSKDRQAIDHELGDVLLMLVNLSRHTKTPPEDALRATLRRFSFRFQAVEKGMREANLALGTATLEQMDVFWNQAKALEKAGSPLAPPKMTPRAAPAHLSLTAPSLTAATTFWDRVSGLLGWRREALKNGQVAYDTGPLRLFFREGPAAQGLELGLELASPAQLEALARALREAHVTFERPDATGLVFIGPEGTTWRAQVGGAAN